MRIVLIFLVLLAVSVTGVSILASNGLASGSPIVGQPRSAAPASSPAAPKNAQDQPPPAQPSAPQAQQASAAPTPAAEGEAVTFTVRNGETTGSIADRLTQAGLVQNALFFRLWVQYRGAEGKLQAGDYQLRRGMSMDELVEALQAAKAKDVAITFIEGRRIEEFAEIVRTADVGIDADRFLNLAKSGKFTYDFLEGKPPSASLEGYLFPDTYRVIPGTTTADDLIHMMLKKFGDTVTPQMREQAKANGLTIHQLATLASIVEREAQVRDERPTIAAVYVNRLKVKEPLGADATIQYAIGKPGEWWPTLRDLARNIAPDSDYNTYTHQGLPPGPISSAGASALAAAADPAKVDYLFYVRNDVKNDGSHVFARTLAEHNANIARYQIVR
jgi:UPF0755 protein